jgi:hypothetical protein
MPEKAEPEPNEGSMLLKKNGTKTFEFPKTSKI